MPSKIVSTLLEILVFVKAFCNMADKIDVFQPFLRF
jgi:hypothetical protein